MFIRLLTGLLNASNHRKYLSLTIQKCASQPALFKLHPNNYTQRSHYCPDAVNLDRYVS